MAGSSFVICSLGLYVRFHIYKYPRVVLQLLITRKCFPVPLKFTTPGVQDQVYRVGMSECQLIDPRLVGNGVIYAGLLLVEIDKIIVGCDFFTVVAIGNNRLQFQLVPLEDAQVKCRTSPVAGHRNGQAVQQITRVIRAFRINTQHAVRQMNRGVRRHQQVADVPQVRVNKINKIS